MYEVVLRPIAEADLDDIADYTIAEWGAAQAREYITALRHNISGLQEFPARFPRYESTVGVFRKMKCQHHLVFFTVSVEVVDVIRILHERMDVESQLAGSV